MLIQKKKNISRFSILSSHCSDAAPILAGLPGVTPERLNAFAKEFSPPADQKQQRAVLLQLFEEYLPVRKQLVL